MKSAKLIDIFKQGHIVIPLFMLQHYKELKLEIGEFLFLMYLYNLGNKFIFDPSKFADDLNLDIKDIMNYIGALSDKHFIRVEVMKNDKVDTKTQTRENYEQSKKETQLFLISILYNAAT